MRRFRFPLFLLAVLGLLAGACAQDGELGGPDIGGSLAASIGSFDYTSAELQTEVEAWASNPAFLSQVLEIPDLGMPGRRSADVVAFVLSHRVISEQARQVAPELEPTEADVAALLDQLDQAFPDPETGEPLFQVYDEEFRRSLARDFIFQQNLSSIDPAAVAVPDVTINPRYGSFEDQDRGLGRVVPPSGPVPAPFSFGQ